MTKRNWYRIPNHVSEQLYEEAQHDDVEFDRLLDLLLEDDEFVKNCCELVYD